MTPTDHGLLQLVGFVLISGMAYAAAAFAFDVAGFRTSLVAFLRSQPGEANLLPLPRKYAQPNEQP
jgi:hypothetical protein